MAPNNSRLRMIRIHNCLAGLQVPGKLEWSLHELAAQVQDDFAERFGQAAPEMHTDTVYKTMRLMETDFMAPIDYRREGNQTCHFYTDPSFNLLEHIEIEREDIESLDLAVMLLGSFAWGTPFAEQMALFKERLQHRFRPESPPADQQRVQFDWPLHRSETAHWQQALEAIRKGYALRLTYQRFEDDPTRCVIHPSMLKEYAGRWYLFSRVDPGDDFHPFSLDRVQALEPCPPAEVTCRPLPVQQIQRYLDERIGVSGLDEGPQEVIFRISNWQLNYLTTRPLHSSQRVLKVDEQGAMVYLNVAVNWELVHALLQLGSDARPISPPGLLDWYGSEVQRMQVPASENA